MLDFVILLYHYIFSSIVFLYNINFFERLLEIGITAISSYVLSLLARLHVQLKENNNIISSYRNDLKNIQNNIDDCFNKLQKDLDTRYQHIDSRINSVFENQDIIFEFIRQLQHMASNLSNRIDKLVDNIIGIKNG